MFKSTGSSVRSARSAVSAGRRCVQTQSGERCMSKSASKILALALVSATLVAAPVISAYAAGGDEPKPPATENAKKKGKKSSSIDSPKFLAGYHTAYAAIYDRHDYAG